ncbi:hypothetical protein [Actinomadura violacea]|uniref:Uncharacterized protein n=1 Tax=Actinomadura violacea TaxID=2819934 RepID=A0ABS3S068_9ACTN|nr:hypothetical protein [Actinomadura violacea]MBO2462389.1 hypothetical protein [Actinomadura violacea]
MEGDQPAQTEVPLIGDGVTPDIVRIGDRTARAAAEADPVFRRFWDEGDKDRMPRAEVWLVHEGPTLAARLTTTSPDPQPFGRLQSDVTRALPDSESV